VPAAILARLALLEARRGGLPWLALAAILAGFGLAAFLAQVALTEGLRLQTAILAAWLRACAVFLIATQVTSSVLREIQDKGLEMMLALPLSRSTQYLGRLGGFATSGILIAAFFGLALLPWAPAGSVALWGVSLALECALVASAALFFAMTLAQFVPAIAATAGLYLLGRSMAAIQAIASGPGAENDWTGTLARFAVDAVALLLPPLDAATRTEWLVYGAPSGSASAVALAGLVVYTALLVAAGLFDFQRRGT
jgi:ABC-type transport system involved in multi-copper enzyme maturation permease subunit